MSKNIRVSSSRIIPGRSILINSNHQSSNMEGKRRNLCTFLFSLSISISFSLSLRRDTRTHTCIVHVYLPGVVSDPNSTTNSPVQTLLFQTGSRVSTQAEVLGALLPVYVCLYSINSTFYTILHVVDFFPLQKWILSIPRGFSFRKFRGSRRLAG